MHAELSKPFPALVITNVLFVSINKQLFIPNSIYGYRGGRTDTVLAALEVLFRQLNHVDGNELISQSGYEGYPSFSVGDRVSFRGPGGWHRTFLCDGLGWSLTEDWDEHWQKSLSKEAR
jgi:hypothetical protein